MERLPWSVTSPSVVLLNTRLIPGVGHDNPSTQCEVGDTDLLLNFNLVDHAGPYDGVLMGCVL